MKNTITNFNADFKTPKEGVYVVIGILCFLSYIVYASYAKYRDELEFLDRFDASWNANDWDEVHLMFEDREPMGRNRKVFNDFLQAHHIVRSKIIDRTEVAHENGRPLAFEVTLENELEEQETYRVYLRLMTKWYWLFYFNGDLVIVDLELASEKPRVPHRYGYSADLL